LSGNNKRFVGQNLTCPVSRKRELRLLIHCNEKTEKIQPGERKDVIPWFLPGSAEKTTAIPHNLFFYKRFVGQNLIFGKNVLSFGRQKGLSIPLHATL
jgi:hypothetical protein